MKIGIVGLGRRMAGVLKCFREIEPELEVAGIVDANPEAAKLNLPEEERSTVRFFDSLDELVAKAQPDALAIATRCDSHTELAIQASKYRLPLFLEKPVATNMSDAIRLEKAFDHSECPVLVSFPLRTSILCQKAKQILQGGAVGRIEHIAALNYVAYGNVYFDTWHRDYSVTQGLFLQKATHDFDYLSYLAGAPVVRVAAMSSLGRVYRDTKTRGNNPDPSSVYMDEIGTPETGMNEDSSSALLEFANGAKGVYTQVFFTKKAAKRRGAVVSGYKGTVEFDWYQNELRCVHHQQPFVDTSRPEEGVSHFGGDIELARNFMALIKAEADSLAPISCGIESVYACLAAKESAETGQFVTVRQLGAC